MPNAEPSFEEDMRKIREKRKVSREFLHQQTKIAPDNIKLFEHGDLEQHPHFNDVYLRALVRAYANVLGISKDAALEAMERARVGEYQGELGQMYLGRSKSKDTGAEASAPQERANGEEATTETGDLTEEEVVVPDVGQSPIALGEQSKDDSAEEPQPEKVAEESATPEPTGVSAQAQKSDRIARRRRASDRRGGMATGGTGRIALGLATVALIGLVTWAVLVLRAGTPEDGAEGAAPTADTLTAHAGAPPTVSEGPPPPIIGDSLNITVIATSGKLEPIRVKVDGGDWDPYWIEEGDTASFEAVDAITLRSYLTRADLQVESVSWPDAATTIYDSIRISRLQVQQHIDSVYTARE